MENRRAIVVSTVAMIIVGCANHVDKCVEFLGDSDLQKIVLLIDFDIEDVPRICQARPFQTIDRIDLNHEMLVNCHDLCEDEFSAFMGSLGTLAVLEEDLCEPLDNGWKQDISHPIFLEFFHKFRSTTVALTTCIQEYLMESARIQNMHDSNNWPRHLGLAEAK